MNEERREAIRCGVIERLKRLGKYTGEFVKTEKSCERCGACFKPFRSSQRFCSTKCSQIYKTPDERAKAASDAVIRRRKKVKKMAIEHLGGRCVLCGYDKCVEALEFHHVDPSEKDFGIGDSGNTRAWSAVKLELEKCALLCANCHREVHAGVTNLQLIRP